MATVNIARCVSCGWKKDCTDFRSSLRAANHHNQFCKAVHRPVVVYREFVEYEPE